VSTGSHSVSLGGIAANCAIGTNPKTVSVAAGKVADVGFVLTCAIGSGVTLTAIAPAIMVEGQSATLTGTGFSANPAENLVSVDGVSASVTSVGPGSVSIDVPTFDCQPARSVAVQITVAARQSGVINRPLVPKAFTAVPVGSELVLQQPSDLCLQFAASAGAEDFLIGVQSTSELVTSLTPVHLTAVAGGPGARPLFSEVRAPVPPVPPLGDTRQTALLAGHGQAELALRRRESVYLSRNAHRSVRLLTPPVRSSARRPAGRIEFAVASTVQVGDTIPIQVPDIRAADLCASFIDVRTVVRTVGTNGIWLEDVTNPVSGFSAATFESLSQMFDNTIYPTDVSYFGTPTDLDGNGRVVIVVTHQLNRFASTPGFGTLGFVSAGDLFPTSTCPASNEGELFYSIAADPHGVDALGAISQDQALSLIPSVVAHEFAHTIQFGRRITAGAPPPSPWFAEGQATLAQEVVSHAMQHRMPGQNYGAAVAFTSTATGNWYSQMFLDLAAYYGRNSQTPGTKVAGAPEQCSWLDRAPDNAGPCMGGRLVYTSWSFLRWLSDQYGPAFAGGEQGLQRALIDDPGVGYANITDVVGTPIGTLLAQWAATLYTDDRHQGLDPRLSLPSWNLTDIFQRHFGDAGSLVARSRGFANFNEDFSVRAASSAYLRVTAAAAPATAIRVRTPSDTPLPGFVQVFVVRLE
jgi:hypothetical protein